MTFDDMRVRAALLAIELHKATGRQAKIVIEVEGDVFEAIDSELSIPGASRPMARATWTLSLGGGVEVRRAAPLLLRDQVRIYDENTRDAAEADEILRAMLDGEARCGELTRCGVCYVCRAGAYLNRRRAR